MPGWENGSAQSQLRAIRDRGLAFHKCLKEILDNSFDAGASLVRIKQNTDSVGDSCDLVVDDDGCGIPDIFKALRSGDSDKFGDDSQTGEYGVGMKDALISFSNWSIIDSMGTAVRCLWGDLISGSIANENLYTLVSSATENRRGSIITLKDLKKHTKVGAARSGLGICYRPRLLSGKRIVFNGEGITCPRLPSFIGGIITFDVEWHGRMANIIGGYYRPNDPQGKYWSGYYLYYAGRLIEGNKVNAGTGDLMATSFCFIVTLKNAESSWVVGTNKDHVEDGDLFLDWLYDAHTHEIIRKATVQAENIEMRDFTNALNEHMAGCVSGNIERVKMEVPEKPGTIEPTGTGPVKVHTTTNTRHGEYIPKDGSGTKKQKFGIVSFSMVYKGANAPMIEIREQARGKPLLVEINIDHENGKELFIKTRNEMWSIAIGTMIYNFWDAIKTHEMYAQQIVNEALEKFGDNLIIPHKKP